MQPDSRRQDFDLDSILGNNDAVNNDIISEIEKELQDNPSDMISLVFLLYDVADTALQRLLVFQQVSKDISTSTNLNMLHEWFRCSKHTPTWKHEFVEALLICQLNNVVKKLGINVLSARKHYQTEDIHAKMYINPVKKALYKVCENMTADNLYKLKEGLLSYECDTTECSSCELVFLKLMCIKFVTVNQFQYNKKSLGLHVNLDKLLRLIEGLPGLQNIAQEIKFLQQTINHDSSQSAPLSLNTPSTSMKIDESHETNTSLHFYQDDFKEVFDMLNDLSLKEATHTKTLKSDRTKLKDDYYEIKNVKRVGVCVIINQVDFYPSKSSIESSNEPVSLAKRKGSDQDQAILERTMSALNFAVYKFKNLTKIKIFQCLEETIKNKVTEDDSVFVLCILSHGVKGHVYATDSVKVNMDDIQCLLDSDIASHLLSKPKLLIVQACQVQDTPNRLVADHPEKKYTLKKRNFLICWATAPDLEAYRDESKGSFFIQILCEYLHKYANNEHISDILTRVTDKVTLICETLGCDQLPFTVTTLRKKLFLQMSQ